MVLLNKSINITKYGVHKQINMVLVNNAKYGVDK